MQQLCYNYCIAKNKAGMINASDKVKAKNMSPLSKASLSLDPIPCSQRDILRFGLRPRKKEQKSDNSRPRK